MALLGTYVTKSIYSVCKLKQEEVLTVKVLTLDEELIELWVVGWKQ